MIDANELRRLAQEALIAPGSLSPEWMDRLGQFQEAADPSAISELLDRLEEAETAWKEADKACRDLTEKVIPNLRESLEAAEKEIALKERVIDALGSELNAVANERDAMRAKLAEMEQQGPVAKVRIHKAGGNAGLAWSVAPLNDFDSLPLMRDGDRLYALPGAQGE